MRRFVAGVVLGLMLGTVITAYPFRTGAPPTFTDFENFSQVMQLNRYLSDIWEITNGKYTMNIKTTNPDGSDSGNVGDMVLFNNGGTYYLEVNVDGSTTWRGVLLTDTP